MLISLHLMRSVTVLKAFGNPQGAENCLRLRRKASVLISGFSKCTALTTQHVHTDTPTLVSPVILLVLMSPARSILVNVKTGSSWTQNWGKRGGDGKPPFKPFAECASA